jgi:hypothetical protein
MMIRTLPYYYYTRKIEQVNLNKKMGEYQVCTKVVVGSSNKMVHGNEESKDHTRDSLLKGSPINEAAVPFTKQKII